MAERHPRGLKVLFFTEMWERFAYYLMLGIFVLYMTDSERNGLGIDTTSANEIYGWFIALVYLTPFIGGILADRYLGYRKSVVIGGLMMAVGYIGVGMLTGTACRSTSRLGLVIFGNGFFKPNISTIVGRLYKEGSPLKDCRLQHLLHGHQHRRVRLQLRRRHPAQYASAGAGPSPPPASA